VDKLFDSQGAIPGLVKIIGFAARGMSATVDLQEGFDGHRVEKTIHELSEGQVGGKLSQGEPKITQFFQGGRRKIKQGTQVGSRDNLFQLLAFQIDRGEGGHHSLFLVGFGFHQGEDVVVAVVIAVLWLVAAPKALKRSTHVLNIILSPATTRDHVWPAVIVVLVTTAEGDIHSHLCAAHTNTHPAHSILNGLGTSQTLGVHHTSCVATDSGNTMTIHGVPQQTPAHVDGLKA